MRKLKQEKKEREMVKEERKMEQELGLGTSARGKGTDTKSGKERKSLAVERGRRKEHRKELRQCYGSV